MTATAVWRVAMVTLGVALQAASQTDKPSERARFGEDVIESLALARDARLVLGEPSAKDLGLGMMTADRRAIAKLRSAGLLLAPYSESKVEMIAETAKDTLSVYLSLIQAFEGSLLIQEKLVDLAPGQPLGPLLSELSKHTAKMEDAWKLLPIAAGASLSHALVDSKRTTADGKLGFLSITQRERSDLLKRIELKFGEEVAAGKVAGLYPPEGSAGLIAKFLRQPWRASDQE